MNVKARQPVLALLATVALATAACAQVNNNNGGLGSGKGGSTATGSGGSSGSGSGGSSATGSGGSSPTGNGGTGVAYDSGTCGLVRFNLERKPAEVMLVLDRSKSMKDNLMDMTPAAGEPTKWSQAIPALQQVLAMSGADISWGLKTFPEDGAECGAGTVSPKIDVPITKMNAATVSAAVGAVQPEGNGTPTGAAVAVAAAYLKGLGTDAKKYILLATDGQPSCYGSGSSLGGGNSAQARTDAVGAVTTAATDGYHTFVVGVATKPSDAMTLNMLAAAGLEPRADPNPLATKYYLAATQNELVTALNAIVGQVSTCTFPLNPPPPVPNRIAVKVTGVKAPQDTTHTDGWDYTSGDYTSLQVYGSWCDMIRTAAANMVEIVYGCQDIIPT